MDNTGIPMCGGRTESYVTDAPKEIVSKEIRSFSYVCGDYILSAVRVSEGRILLTSSGGGKYGRDGSRFTVKYETEDKGFLDELQHLTEMFNLSYDNGHCVEVSGLPYGIGDTINIIYESGERIYRKNNQCRNLNETNAQIFYNLFRKDALANGFDFSTAGSNVQLYDDADEKYLQGTWKGRHFGDEVSATFEGNRVTITVNGTVTDEAEYTVSDGTVVPKDGKMHNNGKFLGISKFAKKNYFTLTGYFTQESYSTCDLFDFSKPKPEK